jgi:hypothetical protein
MTESLRHKCRRLFLWLFPFIVSAFQPASAQAAGGKNAHAATPAVTHCALRSEQWGARMAAIPACTARACVLAGGREEERAPEDSRGHPLRAAQRAVWSGDGGDSSLATLQPASAQAVGRRNAHRKTPAVTHCGLHSEQWGGMIVKGSADTGTCLNRARELQSGTTDFKGAAFTRRLEELL